MRGKEERIWELEEIKKCKKEREKENIPIKKAYMESQEIKNKEREFRKGY